MDFQTKRQSKKYAKLCFRIAWGLTMLFMLLAIAVIVVFSVTPKSVTPHDTKGYFWIMLLFMSPLFTGFGFAIFGQYFLDKRIRYKRMISEYRQRRFFTQIMGHIYALELDEAMNKYDELLKDRDFRKFVYPIIITKLIESTDENKHKYGLKLLNDILEKYNPSNINFNS